MVTATSVTRKHFIKGVGSGALLLAAGGLLQACGGGGGTSKTVNALLLGGGPYETLYDKAIPLWEKKTGGTVRLSTLAFEELRPRLILEVTSGSSDYDAFSGHNSHAPDVAKYLTPIEDKLSSEDKQDFGKALEMFTFSPDFVPEFKETHTTEIPRHFDTYALVYRKDLFESAEEQDNFRKEYGYELKVPTDWKEFVDIANFFTRDTDGDGEIDLHGFALSFLGENAWDNFAPWLWQNGGHHFDENFKPAWNSSNGIEALETITTMYKNIMPKAATSWDWTPVEELFVNGNLVMNFQWPGFFAMTRDSKLAQEEKVGYAPLIMHGPQGQPDSPTAQAAAHSFNVPTKAPHADAALDFIQYLTSSEMLLYEATQEGFLPTRESAFNSYVEKTKSKGVRLETERLQAYQDTIPHGATSPKIPVWDRASRPLWENIHQALAGQKSPAQALNDSAKAAASILKEEGFVKSSEVIL